MRVVLHKVVTSPRERTTARAMQADLRLPDDAVPEASVSPSDPPADGIAAELPADVQPPEPPAPTISAAILKPLQASRTVSVAELTD